MGGRAGRVPLAGLAEFTDQDELPLLAALDPYRLGATPASSGTRAATGSVTRMCRGPCDNVNDRLRAALQPRRLVLVVGPSKSGKTRTAFEAARRCWPQARLLVPTPAGLDRLVTHPLACGHR